MDATELESAQAVEGDGHDAGMRRTIGHVVAILAAIRQVRHSVHRGSGPILKVRMLCEEPPVLRLYDNHLSGNGYKPRLLLAHLGRTYERIEVDILTGETRTPEFLAKNPNGRIPVLELENGTCISESNAILFYLAEGSRFLPPDPQGRAVALQWMFFEQYSHEPFIAVARHWIRHVEMTEAQRAQLPEKQDGGRAALAVMEQHLARSIWFGGDAMGIADIALYAYTHVAREGGFDLEYLSGRQGLARTGRGAAGTCPDVPRAGGNRRARFRLSTGTACRGGFAGGGLRAPLTGSCRGSHGTPIGGLVGLPAHRRASGSRRVRADMAMKSMTRIPASGPVEVLVAFAVTTTSAACARARRRSRDHLGAHEHDPRDE